MQMQVKSKCVNLCEEDRFLLNHKEYSKKKYSYCTHNVLMSTAYFLMYSSTSTFAHEYNKYKYITSARKMYSSTQVHEYYVLWSQPCFVLLIHNKMLIVCLKLLNSELKLVGSLKSHY